jgi:hypothetical protein
MNVAGLKILQKEVNSEISGHQMLSSLQKPLDNFHF